MKLRLVVGILVLLTGSATSQTAESDLDLLDSALSQVGMTREDVRFETDELEVFQGHPWRLSYFELFHRNPFKLPQHGELNLETFRSDGSNIASLLKFACRTIEHPIRRGLISDPLTPYLVYPDTLPVPSITRSKNFLSGEEFDRLKNVPVADMSEQEYAYFKVKARENPGAMVVDFNAALSDPSSSSNLLLKRGDLIVFPTRREFVSVLGLVRHPGNVTYRPGLEAKDYVKLAGGYSADADRGRSRVIRAEGGEWMSLRRAGTLRQGDSVFVPEKPDLDYWRAFRDFLTVAMQLATIYLVVDSATH